MSKGVIIEWPFEFENPGILGIFGNLKVPLPKSKPKMFEPQERGVGRSKIEGFSWGGLKGETDHRSKESQVENVFDIKVTS